MNRSASVIRIVAADDHERIREGVKKIVRSTKEMRVMGVAATIAETINLIREHTPDIVVLDISLPGNDGLSGLGVVRNQFPDYSGADAQHVSRRTFRRSSAGSGRFRLHHQGHGGGGTRGIDSKNRFRRNSCQPDIGRPAGTGNLGIYAGKLCGPASGGLNRNAKWRNSLA
jgi:hypothetical protein